MEACYDEDLSENPFFKVLRQEYASLFERVVNEGLIVCVPRCGTLTKCAFVEDDFLCHILSPLEDAPTPSFRTLAGKEVKLSNRVLTVQYDVVQSRSAHLLFEETFYTERCAKYSLWCIERPLERRSIAGSGEDVPSVTTLRDALDFLWTEVSNKETIKSMSMAIQEFEERHESLEEETIESQREAVARLNAINLGMLLEDARLRAKTESNAHYLGTMKIAAETYTLHGLRNVLPQSVAARTRQEDASLNKIIKNLHDVQLRDLGISSDMYDGILRGKVELSRLAVYSTVLGKIACLKKSIRYATEEVTKSRLLSSDDILPVLIFLVIRAGVPNWIGQLIFMKQFRFSNDWRNNETDEAGFLITCLEAAIEHVRSGVLEATAVAATVDQKSTIITTGKIKNDETSEDKISLADLFTAVKKSNLSQVEKILSSESCSKMMASTEALRLCHPLCTCEKCETRMAGASLKHQPPTTVRSRDDRGMTAIHVASLYGRVNIVDYLLEHGADPNDADGDGATPLHCAASRGHQNTLLILLHANADPRLTDSRGNTPLHIASDHGHEGCVKALLYFSEQMAIPIDKSPVNSNGETPLHHAAKWGYDDIVLILMEHGANARATDRRGQSPLAVAHNSRISKLLQTHSPGGPRPDRSTNFAFPSIGAKPSAGEANFLNIMTNRLPRNKSHKAVNGLLAAVMENDVRLACHYLGLDMPASKSAPTRASDLCHPLCNCEKCDISPNCDYLPSEQDDLGGNRREKNPSSIGLDTCNEKKETPLHVACDHGHAELVEILLDAGASIRARTIDARTPLHLACFRGYPDIVKLLLNSGNCDINAVDAHGDTSLHLVTRNPNLRIVQLLVRYGARTNVRNSRGITPLEEIEKITTDDVFIIHAYSSIANVLKNYRTIDSPQ